MEVLITDFRQVILTFYLFPASIPLSLLQNVLEKMSLYRVGHEKVARLPFSRVFATVLISVFRLCYGPGPRKSSPGP